MPIDQAVRLAGVRGRSDSEHLARSGAIATRIVRGGYGAARMICVVGPFVVI